MKKHASKIIALFIMVAVALYIPMAKSSSQAADVVIKNLEGVLFEKLPGKERISLVVSQQPEIKAEGQTNGSLLVRLEDTVAAENLRRSLGEGQLNNILRVTPSQQKVNGKQWTNLMIDIRELVPYSIKKEGKNILIDFNVAGLAIRKPVAPVPPVAAAPAKAAPTPAVETKKLVVAAAADAPKVKTIIKEEPPKYAQRKISVDFQDAEIQSVLRLMAEYGNVNIVAGDDVKGKVTLAMKNVPWEQALDTILELNSLAKRQEYNVITVTTMAKVEKMPRTGKSKERLIKKFYPRKGC
jgi:type IV pilus assembly protein PilQ